MKPKDWEVLLCACLLATAVRHTQADANSFFNSLGDTFRDAGQTIAQGTQRAYSVVKNDTINAAQATGGHFPALHVIAWTSSLYVQHEHYLPGRVHTQSLRASTASCVCALLSPCHFCILWRQCLTVHTYNAGSAFRQAGDTMASTAKDVYNQSVQFARQEWNGTQRAINTVEGALQVR